MVRSRPSFAGLVAVTVSILAGLGCATLRQNMRGQELSYRGAWYCDKANCKPAEMTQSRAGTRDGEVSVNTVKLAPRAALMFTAAAPFESLRASVRDCKGNTAQVLDRDVSPAGGHGVGDQDARESWAVWIDPGSLDGLHRGKGACAVWKVEASATWADGASYSLTAGIDIQP